MSEYTLKFEAKFADGDADLIVKVAALLGEARAEIQRAEIDRLHAEVERLREEFDLFKTLVGMDGGESILDHWEYVKRCRAALEPK